MHADAIAIGTHPDDLELSIGGTLHKLASRGHRVVIADLTRGEMSTRGNPKQRESEAQEGCRILGAFKRVNLQLPDGRLQDTFENRKRVIELFREFNPEVALCPYWHDLHPDHAAAGEIVRMSLYASGFAKFPAGGEPFRPKAALFYMFHLPFEPAFIVDTSEHFSAKREAIQCHRSQLFNPESTEKETNISRPDFLERIKARDKYFGSLIQAEFGEPFFVNKALPMDDPVAHFRPFRHM